MNEMVLQSALMMMLSWFSAHTDYADAQTRTPPRVMQVSQEVLDRITHGTAYPMAAKDTELLATVAHYVRPSQRISVGGRIINEPTILVAKGFSIENLKDAEVMVHELTHYLQDVNGHLDKWGHEMLTDPATGYFVGYGRKYRFVCMGEAEIEAYKIAARFVEAHGGKSSYSTVLVALVGDCDKR
jgi:hypothetical protein